MMMKYISVLLMSGHTVFNYKILQDILRQENKNTVKSIVSRLLHAKILLPIYPGFR